MASSSSVPSSSSAPRWKYDVFLSFRGVDSRKGITFEVYDRLQARGIKTFMDDSDLEVGDAISPTLIAAIEESRFAIIVFSHNYASSIWCLEELAKICECMEDQNRILPLFYHVEPSDVRYQKRSFEEAFSKHETSGRHPLEKVKQWRYALNKVAGFSGWNTQDYNTHRELVEAIVESVRSKLLPDAIESTGDFQAYEATRQATIEIEPSMSESSEDFELVKVRRQPTNEIEPTMPQLTEDFEAVEATNGNSEPAPQWKYDVFLSFRGEDTRKGFLSHLYHELQNTKVIRTFKDDQQLEKGKNISQSLLTAIEESRFAIIVLSENYAFSSWCLDELTKIFQCMEDKDTILPIFYYVDPSDVRYQKNKLEVAFTKHSSNLRYSIEKIEQWRADLTKVGHLSGWDSKNYKSERELIEDIVKFVRGRVPQAPRGDFEEFEATREAMDEVKKMLNDDKITAIGVYGRGGVGKTAMVKHVSAQAKRIGLFDHIVMAVITRNPDLQKIQGALVNQLGLELVEDEEIERASRLKERIMGGKRILIILDDIQEKIDLSSIGIPSYDELQRCNSKVLLTTRMRNICHSMGCQEHIPLNILSEQDSLKLFMKKSRKPFLGSTDSYDEERNVVRECSGLPSVLEEAARAFGHKYVEEWNKAVSKAFGDDDDELQKAAQELNASQLVPTKDERDTFKRMELSYHTLRFDDAKSFLLLCCMFPEDYDIPIEDLFKYGIGRGLLQYSDTLQEARDRAHSLVAYLKASGLLLDGKKECIRMHFDVRNVAMSIALSEGHAFFVKAGCELKDWPMDAHEGYSAISLMRNKLYKLPETSVCTELQLLLLQSNTGICDIPKTFFQSPNALRVFDLSYTGISVLPSSFNLLTNLQALHLDCCKKITDISVLGKLKKVEILSLREFPLKELPEEIGNLTSLRMLDVTGGFVHKIPSEVISRLYRLEELYMKCEFGDWGSKVEEAVGQTNADFDEITGLSRLNILKVYISDAACLPRDISFEPNWVKFDICISRDLSLEMVLSSNDQPSRTLTLDRTINGLSDWFINVVTQKAEKVEYRECKGLNNILKEYEHGRLHGLKYLFVIGVHENLEELINATTWDPSKPVFESLEELHLLHLQRLKELCVGELPRGSLSNLKLLKVQTCRNLVNALLPPKLLQRLTNLETIFCVNMKHMKYVYGSEGLEPGTILWTKLSEMRLCALFELISIWNGPAPLAVFGNVKVLAVCKCTKLKSLFPFDVVRSLVQLEDLSLECCSNLGRVIEACNSLNRCIFFPKLKKLALINLPELTWFCTENGSFDIECPLLEYLYVDKCPQFINSASASVKLNDQQHLNSLAKRWKDMHNL
ncbi:probable disease resistance protein At4g27220 [Rosa rugosa]|uniref:probable disease resistance protein At4g27220 n=1 Tax=Rosa rugosa TaxID=74645 RepID=UPI002B40F8EB|nr:probable disease resistance protein At4g27220 [Rosa rugosa]XP_061990318.1 probable disease resistance protein At4g27220 [Rosa rugosa]